VQALRPWNIGHRLSIRPGKKLESLLPEVCIWVFGLANAIPLFRIKEDPLAKEY
jgi:hypothetical protein